MKLNYILPIIIIHIFLLGCARQTSPTGGPKDTIPPVLKTSIPKKGQVNYKDLTLELNFSEAVQLNNPKEQILISPSVGKDYNISAKKNKVTLTFDKPLRDSTTYSIFLRESVQDLTEKNPAKNVKLAFSTGSYIDSLTVQGNTYDLLTGKPIKGGTVALYSSDTFNIFKNKTDIITKTDDNGKYALENLKPGTYYLYGMDDKNKNLIADSKSEAFGFIKPPYDLRANLKNINIGLIRLDARPLKLTSARPYNTYFNVRMSKPITTYSAKSTTETIVSTLAEDKTNIKIYNTIQDIDSTLITFYALDSLLNVVDTSFYIKFNKRDIQAEKFEQKVDKVILIPNKNKLSTQITFTKPLLSINYDSIKYKIDSLHTISFEQQDLVYDSTNSIIYLSKQIDGKLFQSEKQQLATPIPRKDQQTPKQQKFINSLYFGKAAFISIELDSSKKAEQPVAPLTQEQTGVLLIEIQTNNQNFIVQLLDKSYHIVQQVRNQKKIQFEYLQPGEYQIRVVKDTNNNGKWDPGNFYNREEPEQIVFYKNEKQNSAINLKANWELGPLLIKF